MKKKLSFSIRGFIYILGFIVLSAACFLGGILFITSRPEHVVEMENNAIVLSEEAINTAVPLGARQTIANIASHTVPTLQELLESFEILGITCSIYAPAQGSAFEPKEDQLSASDAAKNYLEIYQRLFPNSQLPNLDMIFYSDYQYSGWLITPQAVTASRADTRVNAVTGKVEHILFPIIDTDYFVKEEVTFNNRTVEKYKTNPVPFLNLSDLQGIVNENACIRFAQNYIEEYKILEQPYALSEPHFEILAATGVKSICFKTDLDYPKSITVYMDLKSDTLVGYSYSYPN